MVGGQGSWVGGQHPSWPLLAYGCYLCKFHNLLFIWSISGWLCYSLYSYLSLSSFQTLQLWLELTQLGPQTKQLWPIVWGWCLLPLFTLPSLEPPLQFPPIWHPWPFVIGRTFWVSTASTISSLIDLNDCHIVCLNFPICCHYFLTW